MNLDQTIWSRPSRGSFAIPTARSPRRWARIRRSLLVLTAVAILLLAPTRATPESSYLRNVSLAATVAEHPFDWVTWQWQTAVDKVQAQIERPARDLSDGEATALVRDYVQRAQQMGALEGEIYRHESGASNLELAVRDVEIDLLQRQIDALRAEQIATRATVEQVIERQVGSELVREGLATPAFLGSQTLPPVRFAFTEPPKQLIVSRRDRIERVYGHTVAPDIGIDEMAAAEARVREQDFSGYVTNVGGLGTFPTMVVDRASLEWIVSTVAHEWTHNYLRFFPLGAGYGEQAEMVIINESVAEIVGNELGTRVLERRYPDLAPVPVDAISTDEAGQRLNIPIHTLPLFDFHTEMRQTRLRVDALLAQGQIEEAEQYMEQRRQEFVEHGYPLRVLNQAYFAFHGSYSTSASAVSPIGPKLELLRSSLPDLATFLRIVRPLRTEAELDAVLAEWAT